MAIFAIGSGRAFISTGNMFTSMDLGPRAMSSDLQKLESFAPERFVVEVSAELDQKTIQQHWREVNTILRLSMLGALPMPLDAALTMLSDFAGEMIPFDTGLVYFWEENSEQMPLRAVRGLSEVPQGLMRGNILNFWASKFGRPLLIGKGQQAQSDVLLAELNAQSSLVVPLVTNNRVLGSMQLFSADPKAFNGDQAKLLWVLSLVAENILNREHANEGLLTFAFTDYLTGLRTRGYFEQQLDLELKRCERRKSQLSLLMLDIDYFKSLNDRHGHHVGDQVLRDVASLLTKDMREIDTVARYGGEEFVIILPETTAFSAGKVAQRIRSSIEHAKFFAGSANQVEHLTMSIGIATYPHDARFKQDLIERADAALYDAKSRGRNQVTFYTDLATQTEREAG
jgi:diguanylate cyclase (GGDEF)-like protein